MTTDENIMEEMLDRATNPGRETVDELSLQMFCMVVHSNPQLVDKAQEMILAKIRSGDITESTRAISLLEECMTKCGADFQNEASKFRFLNELIRLVSKNHRGAETPTDVKQRIMECLLLWTTEFPQRTKIREVYDMLRKEEGVDHGNNPAAEAKRESVLGIDEEMLAKLIKSNDPENFKRANLLIQFRVNQESRRTEFLLQHKSILQEVENTIGLLNQMLDAYEAEGIDSADNRSETLSLMRDLYVACKKHKPILERLPALMEHLNDALIIETVECNESLLNVMRRYKSLVAQPTKDTTVTPQPTATVVSSTNVGAPAAVIKPTADSNADLLSDLLGIVPSTASAAVAASLADNDLELLDTTATVPVATTAPTSTPAANTLDELNAIFGEGDSLAAESTQSTKNLNEIFGSLNLLEPISVFNAKGASDGGDIKMNGLGGGAEKRAFRELPAIDKLSEDLFKQSLQSNERVCTFKKEPERCTLNDLVKERIQSKPASVNTTPAATPTKTLFAAEKKVQHTTNTLEDKQLTDEANRNLDDDVMLTAPSEQPDAVNSEPHQDAPIETKTLPVKHLSDITIDLDDVVPATDERVLMDDDDVKLTLNFTENRPSRHVSLIVLSACNKSKLPVQDFQFEASVRKPCKVRLLPPTAVTMPPHKPFRPATPINQVMLLLNPTGKAVNVTCIVGYKLGNDPDPIKESIVAEGIPFVE